MRSAQVLLAVVSLFVLSVTVASAQLPTFNVVGSAVQLPDRLRLTSSADFFAAGAGWIPTKQDVGVGFSAMFDFQLTDCVGACADGFAFVVQNDSHSSLGLLGGFLGYDGIPNSLAVEFDTSLNADDLGDPNGNHISVHTRGTAPNSANESFSIGSTTSIGLLADGNSHTVKIEYAPDTLSVFLDDLVTPVLTVPIGLASTLVLDADRAFVGFTAGTGAGAQNHDILSFTLGGVTVLDLGLSVNPVGKANRVSGAALISGSVTCNDDAAVTVTGDVHQRAGRFTVIHGTFSTIVQCSPPSVAWSATVLGDNGPFIPGWVEVTASASGCSVNCDSASSTQMVLLRGSR